MYDTVELVLESLEEESVAENLHDSGKWCFSATRCCLLCTQESGDLAIEIVSLDETLCQVW